MVDRPIIFSAPMVRALLHGRKTQTRRIIKPHPVPFLVKGQPCEVAAEQIERDAWPRIRLGRVITRQQVRYRAGMQLWVRENCWADWQGSDGNGVRYQADGAWIRANDEERWAALDCYAHTRHPDNATNTGQLVPSIHMPRWASRLTLTVTDVRVQQLLDMSEDDAIAEGIAQNHPGGWWSGADYQAAPTARAAFALLWNRLHGEDAWDANPHIVALTFSVERRNVDAP